MFGGTDMPKFGIHVMMKQDCLGPNQLFSAGVEVTATLPNFDTFLLNKQNSCKS
jgi:hypothetical protein